MLSIVGFNQRTWLTVLMSAFLCCLATNAMAEKFDFDSAIKKTQAEINNKDYVQAFNTIKEIGHYAFRENNSYGKYIFYSATAALYYEQGDYEKAENEYKNAIAIAKSLPEVDPAINYLGYARCLDKLTRRSEGVDLLKKGLTFVKSRDGRAQLHIQLGKMLYWEKRNGDYIANYNEATQYFVKEISYDMAAYMKVLKEIIEGDIDKAEKTAMNIKYWEDRNAALREVYISTGNYQKAYPIFKERASRLETKELDQGKAYHIAEMDADIINSRLNLSRLKLEYEMAQQKLKMNKEQDLLNESRNENIKIKLANDSQLIARMRADSLVKSAETEERDAQYQMLIAMGKRHRITMTFCFIIFVFVIAYSVVAWISNRMVIRNLKKKQQMLTDALDKAQETERMKTAFVDNLGFEVKTPMNKVLGLVENALGSIDKLSKEEKKQIEKEISDPADSLTAMLNNVLKNSLTESGRKIAKTIVTLVILALTMIPHEAMAQTADDKIIEINEYLKNGKTLTARQLASELLNESNEKKDKMGQYVAMKTQGDVQRVRRFYKNAIQFYLDAYVIYLKNQLSSDPSSMLINLSKLYRQEGEYDEAAHYLKEAERHCKITRNQFRINLEKAQLAFETNNKPEFVRIYTENRKMKAENGFRYPYDERLLDIMYMLFDGKRDKALERAKHELTDEGFLHIAELDCAHNGEWKEACELFQQAVVMYRKKMKDVFEADRKEMSEIAGNNLLETKNMQMKLTSANLNIEQLRQQGEIERFKQTRNKLIIDNNALVINRMKAEQKLANAMANRKDAVIKMQQQKSELNKRISILILISVLIVTIFLSSYLWHSHKSKKRLKEKNDELNAAIGKAQESEKLKSTFIQNMSHEIRTPLNAIVGFSKLLLNEGNELDENEKEDFVRIIRSNEEMLKQLIDDVMSLRELHSGEYKMTYSIESVNNLCRTAIETVRHRSRPNVPILFNTNVNDYFTINTDGMRVAQVIINFLTNAIKYTEEGNITVECSYDKNNMLTISVADTGCGIPKDKQQEIFERFAKLDSFHQGTGLGLNICHVISQRLGGKVGIDPEYDKGSRFYLTLPCQ